MSTVNDLHLKGSYSVDEVQAEYGCAVNDLNLKGTYSSTMYARLTENGVNTPKTPALKSTRRTYLVLFNYIFHINTLAEPCRETRFLFELNAIPRRETRDFFFYRRNPWLLPFGLMPNKWRGIQSSSSFFFGRSL